jgi:hypothetical protein
VLHLKTGRGRHHGRPDLPTSQQSWRRGATALASGEMSRTLKRLARQAVLEPSMVSGHSARVGMAQDLVARGADLPAVMQAGRWAMPARYAERLLAGRGAVVRMQGRGNG